MLRSLGSSQVREEELVNERNAFKEALDSLLIDSQKPKGLLDVMRGARTT
jgi:hypothetical protein